MLRSLTNIIENALHAMPSGGALTIAATVREGMVSIEVADTGAGLDDVPSPDGIGLANIRERLELLYGDRAELDLTLNRPRGFRARILLPAALPVLRTASPRA